VTTTTRRRIVCECGHQGYVVRANAHAWNSANVFPSTGDAINALGANNAFAMAAGKVALFLCASAGQWHTILTA